MVLLDGSYWSTRPNNDFTDCLLKITYIGDFGFKELCTESALIFGEQESKDSDNASDIDQDLKDTGLFGSENDSDNDNDDAAVSEDEMDVKPPIWLQCSFITSAADPIVLSDEEQLDVKPTIRLACSFSTQADNPIVLSDDKQVEQVDVKPFVLDKITFTTTYEDPIVLSDTEEHPNDTPPTQTKDNHDNQQATSGSNTAPNMPKFHRIKRDRKYSCYIRNE